MATTGKLHIICLIAMVLSVGMMAAKSPVVAYDVSMAEKICAEKPLEKVEGIWVYPEDEVTVMILNDGENSPTGLDSYDISVVKTSDSRLHPGELIGKLEATAQEGVFKIELFTERKNDLLLKSKSCLATLNNEGDAFIIKKQKAPFKGRLNLNLSRLLPGFWKIVSLGISQNNSGTNVQPPVGMVKIYPSYDGNGSTRRKIRYL